MCSLKKISKTLKHFQKNVCSIGFSIHHFRTVSEKVRIKLTDLLENCESFFFIIKCFLFLNDFTNQFSLSQPLRLRFFQRQNGNIQASIKSKFAKFSCGCAPSTQLNDSLASLIRLKVPRSQENSEPFSNACYALCTEEWFSIIVSHCQPVLQSSDRICGRILPNFSQGDLAFL